MLEPVSAVRTVQWRLAMRTVVVDAAARHGAPESFRFDSLAQVRAHAARIFVRAAGPNTTMPTGPDDPPADERDRLAEWLACGAP